MRHTPLASPGVPNADIFAAHTCVTSARGRSADVADERVEGLPVRGAVEAI